VRVGRRIRPCLLLDALEVAARLGCPRVNTYFGAPGFRDDAVCGDNFLRNIAPALARADQLGVTIVLENEFNAFGRDHVRGDLTRRPPALRDLVRRSGSPRLRLNFDAANFYCAGVEPYPYAYGVVHDLIDYVHVKDIRLSRPDEPEPEDGWQRYRDYTRSYATTWLGSGAVNWTGLIDRLYADGYEGPLTLEPHALPEHRTSAFAQGIRWLRRHLDQPRPQPANEVRAAS
jgi:sugar phosphate isomerase/epimerase